MTEQEIRMAKYYKSEVLPKLQETQRDLFLDEHIRMEITCETYKMCVYAYFLVVTHSDGGAETLCRKDFSFTTFLSSEENMVKRTQKTLRGIQHFVKNWQERLG